MNELILLCTIFEDFQGLFFDVDLVGEFDFGGI